MAWWGTMHVITDRNTGRGKGFEFVEMPDCQAAQAAMVGLRCQECAGRTFTVSEGKGHAPHRASRRAGRGWAVRSPRLLSVRTLHALVDRRGQTPAEAGAARPGGVGMHAARPCDVSPS
jgi:RNA recognition motif-containing protein